VKFYPPNSRHPVSVNITNYLVDWDRVVSRPQKAVKDFLRPYWKAHVVLEEFRIPKKLWRVDLMSLTSRIAIEVSPSGSHSFNRFFHKNRARFGAAMQRELDKAAWLDANGFTLVEIYDEDIPILSREWFRENYGVEI
jgi:hypothetical protein